jgi:hypothetical protein
MWKFCATAVRLALCRQLAYRRWVAVIMAKPKKLVPWIVGTPEPVTPNLTDDQKDQIAAAAGIGLSANDWGKVELARRDYVWSHWAKRQAIDYQSFAARLKLITQGTDDLLRGLCGAKPNQDDHSISYVFDATSLLVMRELAEGESSPLAPMELVPSLHLLRKSAGRALQRTEHWSEQNAWRCDWHGFVNLLASVFENHSLKPTAAKTSRARNPKPSPFVKFVWSIMKTIQPDFREHMHSCDAMADAVATSLAVRRPPKLRGE